MVLAKLFKIILRPFFNVQMFRYEVECPFCVCDEAFEHDFEKFGSSLVNISPEVLEIFVAVLLEERDTIGGLIIIC